MKRLIYPVTRLLGLLSLVLVIDGCKTKEQSSVEMLIQNTNELAADVGSMKTFDKTKFKKYEQRHSDLFDSTKSYAGNDAVNAASLTEMTNQLDEIRRKLDSISNLNVLNRMIGYYKGKGQTGTMIPDWGIVPSGIIITEILIAKDRQMFYSASSPDFSKDQVSFKIADSEEKNDSTIVGYFQNHRNGAKFCSFEWTPSKLSLEGNLWKSENVKE